MTTLRRLSILAFLLILLSAGQTASAHGYIVRAIPEDRAVLERAPARLQYWFSEALEPEFSELKVRDQTGEIIAEGGVDQDDHALMAVRLPTDLPDGAYVVELRPAFASDGHVIAESRVFFIGEEVGGVAGQSATESAVPLEVVWRVITLASTLLLFGTFTLYALVLVPAWGNPEHEAGLLPPRVMKRLDWIAAVALVVAAAGNMLALIQQTMAFFNVEFTRALDTNLWQVVRIGSRFGDVWNLRMFFLFIVAMIYATYLFLREAHPYLVRGFWVSSAWVMALVIGSFSVLSHAAGSLLWPWVGMAVDWLHALAVGFWVGGLAALVLVLPAALRPYEAEARRTALLAVLRRFSRLAVGTLLIVVTTGLYSASNWVDAPSDVTGTNFGGALVVKVMLAAALIGVGALHHIALRPERYARYNALTRRIRNFTATLRLETLLALAVLAATALLTATPVPVPDFARESVEAPNAARSIDNLTVTMSISPGGPGINTYDVTATREGEPTTGLDVRLQNVFPARDLRSPRHEVEPVDAGLYVTASDDIDREGEWWTLLDISQNGGDTVRLAFDWAISEAAAVKQSLDPNVFNIAALLAVLAAIGWVIYPWARRLYHRLDLRPVTVTVAVGAVVVTVVGLVIGWEIVQNTRDRYAETINPPPEVVNSVLPTQESLARGQALYEQHCIGWQAVPRDFNALRERLPRTRDDELYEAVTNGWRDLPPCEGDLTPAERWDIVNYFRTFELG